MIYLDHEPCEIVYGNIEQGIAHVKAADGWEGTVDIVHLRATRGIGEIHDEIEMKNAELR